ncbi:brachyurin-like [Aedes albopictus]|uniref:Peptidase S1 domain-containing protein n=1 Tax=Aedes albopictus TaxID=7160 RepID=A0ABM1XXT8_AEDAL|nr:brachyurin-like [Aedes albopictus]
MWSAFVVLLSFTFASANPFPNHRIMNGNEATPGQFPYMVSLQMVFDGNVQQCAGSLISHRYVLTAAHCLYNPTSGTAIIGAHNLAEEEDHRIEMDLTTDNFILHEDFFPVSMRNDLGLVRLPEEVEFSGYIQPVKLPRWSDGDFTGYMGTFAGWGVTQEPATEYSDVLMYINNRIYSNEECQERFWVPMLIEEQNVCMSGEEGRSACIGDSGGPATVQVGADVVQIGVFSFGPASHCLDAIPIVCARVSYYLGWIQANSDVIIEA